MSGLAQVISNRQKIKKKHQEKMKKSFRLQAQILHLKNVSLLWINVYFPTDPQTANFNDTDLLKLLHEIKNVMDSHEFDHVMLNGDINWDPSQQTGFSNTVSAFLQRLGLHSAWE